jgi:hypothetical protein
MNLENLLENVVEEVVELKEGEIDHDLESSGGRINFINTGGVFKTTIERAFLEPTKSGGISFTLHTNGENNYQGTLFPFNKDKKTKKITTTNTYKGKTVTNSDFKLLKQLYYVATGELLKSVQDIDTTVEDVKYNSYGKEVEKKVAMITALVGKDIHIGIRRKVKYAWDKDAKEQDKTQYATNKDGDLIYDLTLFSVYNDKGQTAEEFIKEKDPEKIEKDNEYLSSDKGIFKPKLEEPEDDIDLDEPPFEANSSEEIDF